MGSRCLSAVALDQRQLLGNRHSIGGDVLLLRTTTALDPCVVWRVTSHQDNSGPFLTVAMADTIMCAECLSLPGCRLKRLGLSDH
jgi:hypothetical protein